MKAFVLRTAAWVTRFGVMIAALAAFGCGPPTPSWDSVQVWGRVTYNGKPVKGGLLVFEPGSTTNSNWGVARIEEDGKFNVITNDVDVNLEPGRFRIYMRPPAPPVEHKHGRFAEEHNESDEKALTTAATPPVPERFLKPETSPLWVELKKEPSRVDIDLKD